MKASSNQKKKASDDFEPSILVFCCNWCSYAGADLAGVSRFQYPPNIRIIRVMCSGRVDPMFILNALTSGIDGVIVTGCHIGDCHYLEGNKNAQLRMEHLHGLIEKVGIEKERFSLNWISASEGKQFSELITKFTNRIKKLGPILLSKIEKRVHRKDLATNEVDILKDVLANTNYCFDCNRCVSVCPLSHLDLFSPRSFVKDLTSMEIDEVLEKHDIWMCKTCGQCSVYCPMTKDEVGVNLVGTILKLRQYSRENSKFLDKCEQCNTHDNIFSVLPRIMADNPNSPNKLGFLEGSGLHVSKEGEIAYFVGCLPLIDDIMYKLDIKYTDIPKTIIYLLNRAGINPVVLNEKCCGHDAFWGEGDIDTFKKLAEFNVELYRNAGVKTIICGCAEGYRTWKYDYPKFIDDFDFEVFHFTEFFLKENVLENVKFTYSNKVKVTYHDSCRLGRLGGIYDEPREILRKMPNVELIEMQNIREDAKCCGVSAFKGCNEYTKLLRRDRIHEAVATGAEYLITPCAKCDTHFTCYLNEPSMDENEKKVLENLKIIDIASFIGQRLFIV